MSDVGPTGKHSGLSRFGGSCFWTGFVFLCSLSISAGLSKPAAAKEPADQKQDLPQEEVKTARKSQATPEATRLEHPLGKPLQIARQSRKALEEIKDYTAIFRKRELIDKKLRSQEMFMKFRREPFSVYFRFRDKSTAGREVIYVKGENRGKLLVHETGLSSLAGTISFSPMAKRVMRESRYPITEMGIHTMLETVITQWESESKFGETTVKYYNQAQLGDVECLAIESSHAQRRREFNFQMTRLYIEKQTKLPLRVEQYGWPRRTGQKPPIVEEYTYSSLQTNVGLQAVDFSKSNPQYSFK